MGIAPPTAALLPLAVDLSVASAAPGLSRAAETAGLLTALLEQGLGELEGVVPRVAGVPLPPGLAAPLPTEPEAWRASPAVRGEGAELVVSLELCPPQGACATWEGRGPVEAPWMPAADVLAAASLALGRAAALDVAEDRKAPLSADPYAVLVAGRGAAVWYGLLPAPPEAAIGDRKRDPIARAVFLDPAIPHAWWLLGRRQAAAGDLGAARLSFARAVVVRPRSAVFAAGEAAAFAGLGKTEAAWVAWQGLDAGDARWLLPRAQAALDSGHPAESKAMLAELPAGWSRTPPVLAVRVALAEALDPGGDHDMLLSRWQAADPAATEPVRKRVVLAVAQGRLEDALVHARELAARGRSEDGQRLAVALAAALGRWGEAAAAADALGEADLAAVLRSRAGAPLPLPRPGPAGDRGAALARVVTGRAALDAGQPEPALAAADAALAWGPWLPEALSLRADALDALGRAGPTADARRRLALADPRLARSPSSRD